MRVLTREELTAATAARQFLIERQRLKPADAIRHLTPLQGQHPPAPHIGLAARVHDFTQRDLDDAIDAKHVLKATLMRMTLHLAHAEDFPAYAQLCRHHRMRMLRKRHPDLDEERVDAELRAFLKQPRTNVEIREHMATHDGAPPDPNMPLLYARTLLPLTFLPPAGHWRDSTRNARFVLDPRPLPDQRQAAALVLTRYLTAFGPASKKDVADWAGVAQREFPWDAVRTVGYRDEKGRKLIDLPGQPLPPASTHLPPRFLGNWDQPLLAYADRDRIIPPDLQPLKLTLSGDCTVTVDGRVAASWRMDGPKLIIEPHTDFDHEAVREEAQRTAVFCGGDEVSFAV
ncbi:winged helix DNA-binding domain-containing protein [Solirubrobacter soli]|uniref:winged helix DNA-binding domain-containing protein n=1 Tax=Solirubrobacter soli TaxID=363832 RepID=UPI0003FA93F1|nr:winged helix DNA-binding domain-containing protein [Solirubrobacter soli]